MRGVDEKNGGKLRRSARLNLSLFVASNEFLDIDNIGTNMIDSILRKRTMGGLGVYGFQQIMFRAIFLTKTDAAEFLAKQNTLSAAVLKRDIETKLSQMESGNEKFAIKQTLEQVLAADFTEPKKRELLYAQVFFAGFVVRTMYFFLKMGGK